MLNTIKNIIRKILFRVNPVYRRIVLLSEDIQLIKQRLIVAPPLPISDATLNLFVPIDHFYSPIASISEIDSDKERIFAPKSISDLPNIDFKLEKQLELLKSFKNHFKICPFPEEQTPSKRYWYKNDCYSYADAAVLFCIMMHYQPKRIIEIGSGFSSAVALDTNEHFFGNKIKLYFIEPYPEDRLYKLLKEKDKKTTTIHACRVQEIEKSFFATLEANDILFIDGSHVSKTGSDVNFLMFDVFPLLKPGVIIHIHDMFFPFEMPRPWIYEGRNWNETYLFRAFLEHNNAYSILFWTSFLRQFAQNETIDAIPVVTKNWGGSLYIIKN
jgi:hypothetical protein